MEEYENKRLRSQINSRFGEGLIPNGYLIIKFLGRGVYGSVYKIKHIKTNKFYALKVGAIRDNEIKVQKQMETITMITFPGNQQENAMAPSIYHVLSNKNGNKSVVMELMKGHVEELMRQYRNDNEKLINIIIAIERMILKLCEHNITHGDLHLQNIAYTRSASHPTDVYLYIIDFGFSKAKKCNSRVERIQLIRGLVIFHEEINDKFSNFKLFAHEAAKVLLRHYNRLYSKHLALDLSNITSEYHYAQRLSRKHLVVDNM